MRTPRRNKSFLAHRNLSSTELAAVAGGENDTPPAMRELIAFVGAFFPSTEKPENEQPKCTDACVATSSGTAQ